MTIQPTTANITYDPETGQITGSAHWPAGLAGYRTLRVPLDGLDTMEPSNQSMLFVQGVGPGSGWSVASSGPVLAIRERQQYDYNLDGVVDGADQGHLLAHWSEFDNPGEALGELLGVWGTVPTVARSQSIAFGSTPTNPNGPVGGSTTAQSMSQPALILGPDDFDKLTPYDLVIRIHCTDGVALTVQPVLYL